LFGAAIKALPVLLNGGSKQKMKGSSADRSIYLVGPSPWDHERSE